jgi:hypothetical protein
MREELLMQQNNKQDDGEKFKNELRKELKQLQHTTQDLEGIKTKMDDVMAETRHRRTETMDTESVITVDEVNHKAQSFISEHENLKHKIRDIISKVPEQQSIMHTTSQQEFDTFREMRKHITRWYIGGQSIKTKQDNPERIKTEKYLKADISFAQSAASKDLQNEIHLFTTKQLEQCDYKLKLQAIENNFTHLHDVQQLLTDLNGKEKIFAKAFRAVERTNKHLTDRHDNSGETPHEDTRHTHQQRTQQQTEQQTHTNRTTRNTTTREPDNTNGPGRPSTYNTEFPPMHPQHQPRPALLPTPGYLPPPPPPPEYYHYWQAERRYPPTNMWHNSNYSNHPGYPNYPYQPPTYY